MSSWEEVSLSWETLKLRSHRPQELASDEKVMQTLTSRGLGFGRDVWIALFLIHGNANRLKRDWRRNNYYIYGDSPDLHRFDSSTCRQQTFTRSPSLLAQCEYHGLQHVSHARCEQWGKEWKELGGECFRAVAGLRLWTLEVHCTTWLFQVWRRWHWRSWTTWAASFLCRPSSSRSCRWERRLQRRPYTFTPIHETCPNIWSLVGILSISQLLSRLKGAALDNNLLCHVMRGRG